MAVEDLIIYQKAFDFLILGTDKAHLAMVRESIRVFFRDRLKLTLHPKKAEIAPIAKGVEFLGYVLYGNGQGIGGCANPPSKGSSKRGAFVRPWSKAAK